MGHEFSLALRGAFETLVHALAQFLPRALGALAVLIVGWLLASFLRLVARHVLNWLRFDQLLERVGAVEPLRRAGVAPPHRLIAGVVYWLTWAAVGSVVLQILGISGADLLMQDIVRYLPRLAAAVIVLVVGFALSSLAWRAALLAAVNAHLPAAKLVGGLVRGLVLVATSAMTLEQLGVGSGVLITAFAIVFGGVMLALGIAFGLGGRHAARRALEQRLLSRTKAPEDSRSHL